MLLLLLCGCATQIGKEASDAARARTLRLLQFEQTELQGVLTKRCAIILTGVEVQSTRPASITVTVNGPPESTLTWALAASVDQHGYFLTAAHLVEDNPVNLVFYDGQKLRAEPARVIAKLSNPEKEIESRLDLAILHVNANLPGTFQWADAAEIRPDELAVQIGASGHLLSGTEGVIDPVCFAGRVQQVLKLPNGGTILKTDLPTRGGDSGGPLFNTKGELLGVHIATGYKAFRKQSLVNRPDLTWLQRAIAADQSLPRNDNPSGPFFTDSSEPLQITINFLSR